MTKICQYLEKKEVLIILDSLQYIYNSERQQFLNVLSTILLKCPSLRVALVSITKTAGQLANCREKVFNLT